MLRRSCALLGALALLALARDASADPEAAVVAKDDTAHAIDRTWLYADDARVAEPLAFIAMASTPYTDVGSDPFRVGAYTLPTKYSAFDGNTAQPGFLMAAGGEVGLLPRLSVLALGELSVGGVAPDANPGLIAGVRLQLSPSSWTHLHIAASAGYLREAWGGPVYDDDNNRSQSEQHF